MPPTVGLKVLPTLLALGVVAGGSGCASMGPAAVTPDEIPALEQKAISEPGNGTVHLRLATALMTAGRCDEAVSVADRGRALLPADPVGPLVIGQCLEEAGRFDDALDLYSAFVERHPDARGVGAVKGRRMIAFRRQARMLARAAIENEGAGGTSGGDRVGVFPFLVEGDSTYQPLQLGLAHMLTTDLALLRRFPMVERVRLDALLEELQLPPEMVDRATAARTGRLLQADRMVLGTVSIPTEREAHLSSNVVLETGEIAEPFASGGDLRNILALEKDLAIRTAEGLGYQLTEAEIQRIRQNAPANLIAFLAFSRGLLADERGDYEAAAAHYAEAVRADPGYQEARQRLETAVGAAVVAEAGGGELMTVAARVEEDLGALTGAQAEVAAAGILPSTLTSSIIDVASHQAERATAHVGSSAPTEVVVEQPAPPPPLRAFILITINIPR